MTPFRLVMGLINVMSTPKVETIADVQRAFNALCETDVQYKPFHNQLSKPQFPILMREVCCRVLAELLTTCCGLVPIFKLTIQDGTSYAIKPLRGMPRIHGHEPRGGRAACQSRPAHRDGELRHTPDTDALPGAQGWREDCCSRIAGTSRSSI